MDAPGRRAAEPVHDPADVRLAAYARVGDAAWLRSHGLFVAEGRLVVERLLQSGRFRVRSVLVTPPALAAPGGIPAGASVPVYVAPPSLLESLTGFNFHQGCLAIAERGEPAPPARVLQGAQRVLALEGIANPDNVGGLFRVAEALGAGGVLLDPATSDPLYRKAIRTSMGVILRLPFARVEDWAGVAEEAKGFTVVALTPAVHARALDAYVPAVEPGERLMLLVGAEGPGLSAAALDRADVCVRIPLAPGIDSLNVVVAAGIALAALRPRGAVSPGG